MQENTSRTLIGQKTRYRAVLSGIMFIACAVSAFRLLSYVTQADKPDSFMVVTSVVATLLAIIFLISTILHLTKKNVVYLGENELIIRIRKERIIPFENIADIRYQIRSNASKRTKSVGSIIDNLIGVLFVAVYKSGTLYITLKSGGKISVSDIKQVESCCDTLREKILSDPPEADTNPSENASTETAPAENTSAAASAENSSESVGTSSDGTKS